MSELVMTARIPRGWLDRLKAFERLFAHLAQPRLLASLALLAVFVSTWTLYAAISAAPAAIHQDMAETYVWGLDFRIGYFEHTNSPLQYVGGSQRYEDAVAFYSANQSHAFIHFEFRRAPWVTPEDLFRSGFLGVCAENDARCLASNAAFSTPQASQIKLTLAHSFWGYTVPPFSFIVTVVPPHR
jgi:hypothetical protein